MVRKRKIIEVLDEVQYVSVVTYSLRCSLLWASDI